jgi:hypothetical protein
MVIGDPGSELVMRRPPGRLPRAFGVKVRVTMQLAPEAITGEEHGFVIV